MPEVEKIVTITNCGIVRRIPAETLAGWLDNGWEVVPEKPSKSKPGGTKGAE